MLFSIYSQGIIAFLYPSFLLIIYQLSDIILVSWKSKNSEYREIVAKRFTISKATWNKTMRLIKNVNI